MCVWLFSVREIERERELLCPKKTKRKSEKTIFCIFFNQNYYSVSRGGGGGDSSHETFNNKTELTLLFTLIHNVFIMYCFDFDLPQSLLQCIILAVKSVYCFKHGTKNKYYKCCCFSVWTPYPEADPRNRTLLKYLRKRCAHGCLSRYNISWGCGKETLDDRQVQVLPSEWLLYEDGK